MIHSYFHKYLSFSYIFYHQFVISIYMRWMRKCQPLGSIHVRERDKRRANRLRLYTKSDICFNFQQVTLVPVVPPLAIFLAKHEVVAKFDLSAVKSIVCGAAPLSGEVQEMLCKRVSLCIWFMRKLMYLSYFATM